MTEDMKVKYADKIAALLRKAESTTPEEAELLVGKAQELMTKYAIEQALIDEANGRTTDEIEQREIYFAGLFHDFKCNLTSEVARANNVKVVLLAGRGWTREIDGKTYKDWTKYTLTGFRSDLDRVELLAASLQVQLVSAQADWWGHHPLRGQVSKTVEHRERRQFIVGYAQEVGGRLRQASARAQAEAATEKAARDNQSESDARAGVALVLRNRQDRVQDWYDEFYGNTLRNVRKNYRPGSMSAHSAGQAAGQRADIGRPGVGGRKGLPS